MNTIVLPVNNGRINVSLENAPQYFIYETDGHQIINKAEFSADGDFIRLLRSKCVDAVLCGSVSNKTRRDLALCGIALFGGVYGNADDVVQQFLEDALPCSPDTMHSFHAVHYTPCAHGDEH